jgi:hypothetical protein
LDDKLFSRLLLGFSGATSMFRPTRTSTAENGTGLRVPSAGAWDDRPQPTAGLDGSENPYGPDSLNILDHSVISALDNTSVVAGQNFDTLEFAESTNLNISIISNISSHGSVAAGVSQGSQ